MSVHLSGVDLVYANGNAALRGIEFACASGEQVALIGPSGAGKTSLLALLGTSLQPSAGEVRLLGASPWQLPATALKSLRSSIGTAYQAPPLPGRQRVITAVLAGGLGRWPVWKALASLLYPLDIPGAARALRAFDMEGQLFERCDQLSGGQLQRAGLARLLYQKAELMLADEPVSALDPSLALQSLQVLTADAKARGATLIASLHAVDLALACFPRIVGIKGGRVVFDLPAAEVGEDLLRELYAGESAQLPTLATEPRFDAHAVGLAHAENESRIAAHR